MTHERRALILVLLVELATARPSSGQQPCDTAPPPPDSVRLKMEEAIPARGKTMFAPAVLTVSWKPRQAGRGQPGSVPLGYVVEAGASTGASDIAVAQTAAAELEYVTPLANGTYYVRVRSVNACGESAPSKESKVRVVGSSEPGRPNPLVLLGTVHATRERLGTSAFVRVMGQVRNGWNAGPANLVTVTATYEDNGLGLGVSHKTYVNGTSRRLKRSGVVSDSTLEAGATGCFLMFAEFKTANVTGLGLTAVASDVESEPLEGVVAIDAPVTARSDEFDDMLATGRVVNRGTVATRLNDVWVEIRNGAGRVLDCRGEPIHGLTVPLAEGLSTKSGLPPQHVAEFTVATDAQFSLARTVRWWVSWDEGPPTGEARQTEEYRTLRAQLVALLETDPTTISPEAVSRLRDAVRAAAESLERGTF